MEKKQQLFKTKYLHQKSSTDIKISYFNLCNAYYDLDCSRALQRLELLAVKIEYIRPLESLSNTQYTQVILP